MKTAVIPGDLMPMLLTFLVGAVLTCCAAAETLQPRTTVYRTTPAQDFRAVVHPTWGDETGPGSVIIDLTTVVVEPSSASVPLNF